MFVIARALRLSLILPLCALLVLAACDSIEDRIAKHYERGQELLDDGATAQAVLEFRNALKLDANHAPSHFAMGEIAERQGNLQAAFASFRKVTDIAPNNLEARIRVARFLLLSGEMEALAPEMETVLRLDPNRADVQAMVASIAIREGDQEAARGALDLALALDPENVQALSAEIGYFVQTEEVGTALDKTDAALALHPKEVGLHIVKLQLLERLQNEAGLGVHLGVMIGLFPEETRFRDLRLRWAMRAGDMAVAEDDLRALAEAFPDDMERVANLIRFLRQQQGDDTARAELAQLAMREDETLALELLLAQFDVDTGHRDKAIDYLKTLVADSAEDQKNAARVALARLLYNQDQKDEADKLVVEILAADPSDVEGLTMDIARLIDRDQLDTAIEKVRTALNEAPNEPRLLLLAGRAQELSGNQDLANDRYASAVRANDYDPGTVDQYVQFLIRSVRFTAAEIVLSEALSQRPGNARLLDLLGFTRLRLDDWLGAEEAARALSDLDPERAQQMRAAILIAQERFDEGVSLLRDLPGDGERQAQSISAVVQTYIQAGQTEEAEKFLDDLLAENAENLQALGLRGNLHLAAGDLDAAETKYRAILAIDAGNGGAHSALSRLLALKGDDAGSEAQLLEGLEASPDNLILLARLAQLRESQGDFDEAIEVYERLYRLVPGSLLIANNLASMLSDHRADDPAEIDRAFTIASRLKSSDIPQYRDTYGWTRYLKGNYTEALERIQPVSEALPDNPWVWYHLGMIHAALDQGEDARKALETALEKSNPDTFPPTAEIQSKLTELTGQ